LKDRRILKLAQFYFTQSASLLRGASIKQRRWPQQASDLV
jgi:hypothetical protein